MPVLANPRHERFAIELAKGNSASEAYVLAGYQESRSAACRLSTNVNVLSRVAELQDRGAKRAEVTLESLLSEAEEARTGAMEAGQFAAAVSAIKEKGVLAGIRVEKSERKSITNARTLSDAELDVAIAAAAARGEAAPEGKGLVH